MSGMLLLVQSGGYLMFIIHLPISMYSPGEFDHDVITGVSPYFASWGTDFMSFGCSPSVRTR